MYVAYKRISVVDLWGTITLSIYSFADEFQMLSTRSRDVQIILKSSKICLSVFEDSIGAVDKRPTFRTMVSSYS